MNPPVRLRDDRRLLPDLAADLRSYERATRGYDKLAGWAALQRTLAAEPPPGAAMEQVARNGALNASSVKLACIGFLITLAGSGWYWIAHPTRVPAPVPSRAPLALRTVSAAEPRPEVSQPVDAPAESAVVPARSTGDDSHDGNDRLQRELAQLARIRKLLASNPRAAYALAQSGHRAFGTGLMYHEREALAILALSALGQHEQARLRALAFSRRFPRSPFLARIEAVRDMGAPVP